MFTSEQVAALIRNPLQWVAGGLGFSALTNGSVIQGIAGVIVALLTLWHSYQSATDAAAAKGKPV